MRPMPSPVSMPRVYGFAPVVDARAAILIVGSMPGVASLQAQQYYAHPRNQFWKIMDHICGAGVQLPYAARLRALQEHGLALWDVLQSCVRPGSLDAAIVHTSAAPNDLPALLRRQPRIARLCCNGGAAYRALQRHFAVPLAQNFAHLDIRQLPSTSPANAGCSPQRKLTAWTAALARPPAAGQPHRPASALL
jgi:hypoxanthine-DNA glycosylase